MLRVCVLFVTAATLLLVPALCTGGWLLHPCECDSHTACEHEMDCAADPCAAGMVRPDSVVPLLVDDPGLLFALPSAPTSSMLRIPAPNVPDPTDAAPASQHGRPFPPSDLPLLN